MNCIVDITITYVKMNTWVEMLQHTVWNYTYVHWVNLETRVRKWAPAMNFIEGVKCLCACIFNLPSSKNIDFKAVLQNTTNSKDIWRNVGGSLTPDVLRVASLGHQFLDVLCCLGAGHATELLGYLVESSLYVPCHVTCISGRKSAFNSPFAVDI